MTTELCRPVSIGKVGASGLTMLVRATEEECAAAAERMDVPAIASLECLFHLCRDENEDSVVAEGRLRAQLTRVCVVSVEEFETVVEDRFFLRFVPAGEERDDPDPDAPDEIPYEGDAIDLGEAALEQLGLALDPYPRVEGASLPDLDETGEASPFSALAERLKNRGPSS